MLTNETKHRINTCRDILVGKLPDPKSQVIQITNALIYKFMDDQDRLAEKLGGKASFFIKELKPYAWHKLFDSKLTNQDRADLYIEGVQKLSEAKHLPELFQEIFKEAYVPFRATQTITLFITEINKFDYNHSEELGNAYEYLLSIMGSQGDAGQFRTPRHIIEFMVDVVDPQKGETVYDPACGTAGFLISAYTHILEANNGKLSATERRKLGENIRGIDISPDMAKMARVNLYLHGFSSPVINEGDTLSDEDLWGTKYDVILANPPFMSPKGGIIPHDKFGVKAKRAEVLFVDYIAEHLKLKGRAAIVVPEGVIFQSGTTYKALRNMLVEDGYLHSVISLPAGVFQPYSGVKTSILVLDREKAKEATEVLFLKIENDGYSLSTQRVEREGSHLLEALEISKKWQAGKKEESAIASWVTKEEIAESGDYNLTAERYRVFEIRTSSLPIVELSSVANIKNGFAFKSAEYIEKGHRVIRIANVQRGRLVDNDPQFIDSSRVSDEFSNYELFTGDILMSLTGNVGRVARLTPEMSPALLNQRVAKIEPNKDLVLPEYIYSLLNTDDFINDAVANAGGVAQANLSSKWVEKYKIPLPPINIQQEIVTELDRYQKIIDGARQVVENYKPSFKIDPEWDSVKIGEVCDVLGGGTPSRANANYWGGDIPWISAKYFTDDHKIKGAEMITEEGLKESSSKIAPKGSTILITRVSVGRFAIADKDYAINQDLTALVSKDTRLTGEYLYLISSILAERIKQNAQGVGVVGVTRDFVVQQQIPLPPKDVQMEIVNMINEEKGVVESNKKMIELFEQKIKDKISEVWGG